MRRHLLSTNMSVNKPNVSCKSYYISMLYLLYESCITWIIMHSSTIYEQYMYCMNHVYCLYYLHFVYYVVFMLYTH